jgi:hypothetical protein
MTPRELEEYSALRATIRERGTARAWIFVVGLAMWGALTIATAALASLPIATLLPLLMLAAVFETVLALHTGVERVGRYLQVFYEDGAERSWEHTAMAFGRMFSGAGADPLFAAYFWLATVLNLIPAALAGPVAIEWTVVGIAHALFAVHVFVTRRRAAHQRAIDLERFEKLRAGGGAPS